MSLGFEVVSEYRTGDEVHTGMRLLRVKDGEARHNHGFTIS
jgi:hypothetical protein